MTVEQKTNPKGIAGRKKVGMHVIPPSVLMQVALALTEGAIKYDPYNWRDSPILISDYYDSTWRHLTDWWEGTDADKASGLPHIIKAIAGLIVLADAIQQGQFIDDRPKKHINPDWMDDANKSHMELLERVKKIKDAS